MAKPNIHVTMVFIVKKMKLVILNIVIFGYH